MTDLIDRQALLEKMRANKAIADEGERLNPDDEEWSTIAECYGDMINLVERMPGQ